VIGRLPVRGTSEGSDSGVSGFVGVTSGFGSPTDPDSAVQSAVGSGLLALGGAVVLVFHLRRRSELIADDGFEGSAAARVRSCVSRRGVLSWW